MTEERQWGCLVNTTEDALSNLITTFVRIILGTLAKHLRERDQCLLFSTTRTSVHINFPAILPIYQKTNLFSLVCTIQFCNFSGAVN